MKNIDAFETEGVVDAGATLRLSGLPFAAGEHVRVLVLRDNSTFFRHSDEELARSRMIREKLKGTLLKYDGFDQPAVPPEDWEAINGTDLI